MADSIDLEQAVKSARQAAMLCVFVLILFMLLLLVDHQARRRFVAGLQGVNQTAAEFAKAVHDAAAGTGHGDGPGGNSAGAGVAGGNGVAPVDTAPADRTADGAAVTGQRGSQVARPRRVPPRVPGDD